MDIFILFVSSVLFVSSIGFVLWYGSELENLERENKELKKSCEEIENFYIDTTNKLYDLDFTLQEMPITLRIELIKILNKMGK